MVHCPDQEIGTRLCEKALKAFTGNFKSSFKSNYFLLMQTHNNDTYIAIIKLRS